VHAESTETDNTITTTNGTERLARKPPIPPPLHTPQSDLQARPGPSCDPKPPSACRPDTEPVSAGMPYK